MQLIFEQTLSQQVNIGDERERNKNKLLAIKTLGSTDILMEMVQVPEVRRRKSPACRHSNTPITT